MVTMVFTGSPFFSWSLLFVSVPPYFSHVFLYSFPPPTPSVFRRDHPANLMSAKMRGYPFFLYSDISSWISVTALIPLPWVGCYYFFFPPLFHFLTFPRAVIFVSLPFTWTDNSSVLPDLPSESLVSIFLLPSHCLPVFPALLFFFQ